MIYIVTNRKLVEKGTFLEAIDRAAANGAAAVILREKDLDYDSLSELAEKVKLVVDKYNVPLIINGNVEIAKQVNAYGVQLSYSAFRNVQDLGNLRLGVSIHSLEEAMEAEKYGADYIIAGNIFETSCKPGLRGKGLDFVEKLSENISIPIVAIGGINLENAKSVIIAGARGVAVMSSAMVDYDGSFMRKLNGSPMEINRI